jgi:pimeloyl-ACP methyl ester carboxylesterase
MSPVSRRQAVAGLAALPFAASSAAPRAFGASGRCFVLVHGAWHGGWCWKKIRPRLMAAGHEVYTPTLTGLGERAHLLTADVGLDTHIQDVVAMLEVEDLRDVVLVGHSYGGMVITGVAQRAPQRLAQLIYLDAFMPDPGRSLADYTRPAGAVTSPAPPSTTTSSATAPARDWRVPPRSTAEEFGVRERADVDWVQARLGSQSGKTFGQPLPTAPDVPANLPRAYIQCTTDAWFAEAAARAARLGYPTRTLFGGGHDVMISEPVRLTTLLLELAG